MCALRCQVDGAALVVQHSALLGTSDVFGRSRALSCSRACMSTAFHELALRHPHHAKCTSGFWVYAAVDEVGSKEHTWHKRC